MGPRAATALTPQMWVVMSSAGVLFVEVTDDRLVPSAKSWVKADHLELWRVGADASSGRGSGCFQPDPNAKALQWGIGLGGQVYKGHGAPAADPTVRVARTERGARFRIVLPDEGKGLTVVYSDSDDGARQKRLIATSRLAFGRPWTVGSRHLNCSAARHLRRSTARSCARRSRPSRERPTSSSGTCQHSTTEAPPCCPDFTSASRPPGRR